MQWIKAIFIMSVLVLGTSALATTWHVEKDGSGDFTVIQEAIDAAQDGDTIMIGPGRFEEVTTLSWGIVVAYMTGEKSLTFIGSGSDATIIGPEEFVAGNNYFGLYGFASSEGPATVRVENLKVENCSIDGIGLFSDSGEVSNCIIENCYYGIYLLGQTGVVEDCQLVNDNAAVTGFTCGIVCSIPHFLARNVDVVNFVMGFDIKYSGSTDVLITDCRFDGGSAGLVGGQASFGAGGTIENCYFTNWGNYGFAVSSAGTVIFRNNVVENSNGLGPGNGIGFHGSQSFTIYDNVISNCNSCMFIATFNNEHYSVHNNHFFRKPGDGLFANCNTLWHWDPVYADFSNNYWGTTDTSELDLWILDGNDYPNSPLFVDYLPMADGPVSTESKTLDGVKALYR